MPPLAPAPRPPCRNAWRPLGKASPLIAVLLCGDFSFACRAPTPPAESAIQTPAAPAPAPKAPDVLHPELENFLTEKALRGPGAGAFTSGVLVNSYLRGHELRDNPLLDNTNAMAELMHYVNSPLARPNPGVPETWYGDLAWRVEVTDGSKELTLYLREGATWHPLLVDPQRTPDDPSLHETHRVTARDFVFTFEALRDPRVKSPMLKRYARLESVEALGDLILRVRWQREGIFNIQDTLSVAPQPEFLFGDREQAPSAPQPQNAEARPPAIVNHWYNRIGLMGAGPYRLVSSTRKDGTTLERNPAYHGEPPAIAQIHHPGHEYGVEQELLLSGGADLAYFPYDLRPNFAAAGGGIQCTLVPTGGHTYIGWNLRRPAFADRRVRKALALAFDKAKLVRQEDWFALDSLARGPFIESAGHHAPELEPLPFDPAEAQRLLQQAGYVDSHGDAVVESTTADRKPFGFELLVFDFFERAARSVGEDLRTIGVNVVVKPLPLDELDRRVHAGDFDAYLDANNSSRERFDPFPNWHSSQIGDGKRNRVAFRSEAADTLLKTFHRTFDERARTELLRELHRILYTEQPIAWLTARMNLYCHRDTLHAVTYTDWFPHSDTLSWWSTRTRIGGAPSLRADVRARASDYGAP